MKVIRHISLTLIAAIFTALSVAVYAQEPSAVDKAVNEIVKKYEGNKGVDCMTIVKGGGLELVKMTLKKEFGKSFMKGVTSITIIEYSEASLETCASLHKDLNVFKTLLEEFDLSGEKEISDNEYIRCFASSTSGTLSDFVIAIDDGKSKCIMYMAGEIIID